MTIDLIIHGMAGRMGRRILALAQERPAEFRIATGLERPGHPLLGRVIDGVTLESAGDPVRLAAILDGAARPVVIDFSTPGGLSSLVAALSARPAPLVSGTTGLAPAGRAELEALSARTAVLWAPNMSLGVHLLGRLVRLAAAALGSGADVEIVETHHHQKQDAPSGTALRLGDDVAAGRPGGRPVGFHSLRLGSVVGDHEVQFALDHEIVTLGHRALSRDVFAAGALAAAVFAAGAPAGLHGMEAVLEQGGPNETRSPR